MLSIIILFHYTYVVMLSVSSSLDALFHHSLHCDICFLSRVSVILYIESVSFLIDMLYIESVFVFVLCSI